MRWEDAGHTPAKLSEVSSGTSPLVLPFHTRLGLDLLTLTCPVATDTSSPLNWLYISLPGRFSELW